MSQNKFTHPYQYFKMNNNNDSNNAIITNT